MKLQYLGDSRDAFKWDLLYHLCTASNPPFGHLLLIPLLTQDDPLPTDGKSPHFRFSCQPGIRNFLSQLASSRDLGLIQGLGAIGGSPRFQVLMPPSSRYIQSGAERANYWKEWPEATWTDAIAFFDPDNGFETKTQKGTKWLRHREVAAILPTLGPEGAAVIYQHRSQRQAWDTVFAMLTPCLDYADWSATVYEPNLAFVILGAESALRRVVPVAESYAHNHPRVGFRWLRGGGV